MKTNLRCLLALVVAFVVSLTDMGAQTMQINGTVTDENGVPIPGVNITVGLGGTSTDFDGRFNLIAAPNDVLEFSYIGYEARQVTVVSGQTTYDVVMTVSDNIMDEIVVVAYGTASKQSITGAVSSISTKDLEKRVVSNVTSALEGSAPGLQFNANSGAPGSSGDIRIRGFTTINGSNSPLFVIDGVPFAGNLNDLNPQDIESISVLKDAASAALYGNRASNGVILIETKGGKANSGSALNVSIKQGFFDRSIPEYNQINRDQFMEVMWQGYRNSLMSGEGMSMAEANSAASEGIVSNYLKSNIYNVDDDNLFTAEGKLNPAAQVLPGYLDDLDWYKGIERVGHRQEYNLNGRNSNERGGYFYSVGYLDEQGYVKTQNFNRFNARLNGTLQTTDWLKTGVTLSGSHQEINEASTGDFLNPFIYSRNIAPIYSVHAHDLATGEYILDDEGNKIFDDGAKSRFQYVGRHVIWENELDKRKTVRNTLQGTIFADINFLNDFTFTIKGDLNVRNSETWRYNNATIGDGAGNDGRGGKDHYTYKDYTGQQLLNWGRSFGDHNLHALVGHENYYSTNSRTTTFKAVETFPGMMDPDNFSEILSLNGYTDKYTLESFFGQVKYNFDNKYYFDASFRRDGSSRFAKKSRWGNFWSAGASWIITREDFITQKWLNDLKLKVSYGEVGDDSGASYYSYQALFTLDQNANRAAVYKVQNAAADLQWETSASLNIGLEGRVFDRANFNLEFFDQRSRNLLFDLNMPLSTGATSTSDATATITKNIGSISNRGIELSVDVDVVKTPEWNWNIGANATWLKNKIVKLPEENRENGILSGNKKRVEGRGIYDFWLYKFIGVDQMTGNSLYLVDDETYNVNGSNPDADSVPDEYLVEVNGNYYTTNPSSYGKKDWSGSAIPDVFGSFSTTLSYNNFSLSGIFTYSMGGKINDSSYSSMMSQSGTARAMHTDILQAWNGVPDGITENSANRIDSNGVPVVNYSLSQYNNATSDRFLVSGDYLNIRNVTFNYSFPKRLLQKIDLKSADIYLSAENLYTFTKRKGINPQYSFAGSTTDQFVPYRTYSIGINIGL